MTCVNVLIIYIFTGKYCTRPQNRVSILSEGEEKCHGSQRELIRWGMQKNISIPHLEMCHMNVSVVIICSQTFWEFKFGAVVFGVGIKWMQAIHVLVESEWFFEVATG